MTMEAVKRAQLVDQRDHKNVEDADQCNFHFFEDRIFSKIIMVQFLPLIWAKSSFRTVYACSLSNKNPLHRLLFQPTCDIVKVLYNNNIPVFDHKSASKCLYYRQ